MSPANVQDTLINQEGVVVPDVALWEGDGLELCLLDALTDTQSDVHQTAEMTLNPSRYLETARADADLDQMHPSQGPQATSGLLPCTPTWPTSNEAIACDQARAALVASKAASGRHELQRGAVQQDSSSHQHVLAVAHMQTPMCTHVRPFFASAACQRACKCIALVLQDGQQAGLVKFYLLPSHLLFYWTCSGDRLHWSHPRTSLLPSIFGAMSQGG
jgi:hypothetical protein